jgi:hypothetical protein
MMNIKEETIMDYHITLIAVDGFADADGVYENREGAWLGQIDDGAVQPYTDEDGDFVPAPDNWREMVIKAL